jgi:hypothetical protein
MSRSTYYAKRRKKKRNIGKRRRRKLKLTREKILALCNDIKWMNSGCVGGWNKDDRTKENNKSSENNDNGNIYNENIYKSIILINNV